MTTSKSLSDTTAGFHDKLLPQNQVDNADGHSQVSQQCNASRTLPSSPDPEVQAAIPEEKPYSIYSSKEKWLIVWLASMAGLFR